MLVLPETPEVKIHLGSRNATDTTKTPGQAGQIFAAPSELAARKPQVGSRGHMMAFVICFCAVLCLKARQVSMS